MQYSPNYIVKIELQTSNISNNENDIIHEILKNYQNQKSALQKENEEKEGKAKLTKCQCKKNAFSVIFKKVHISTCTDMGRQSVPLFWSSELKGPITKHGF